MDKIEIQNHLNDVEYNINQAVMHIEDDDLEEAISELEIARGGIDACITELREASA